MDTDDLSDKTYRAIMVEAENFNPDLTLHFGLLSGQCEDEAEFIKLSKALITELKQCDGRELEDIFFGAAPSKHELHKALDKISANIASLRK
jgi:hypothetical protein